MTVHQILIASLKSLGSIFECVFTAFFFLRTYDTWKRDCITWSSLLINMTWPISIPTIRMRRELRKKFLHRYKLARREHRRILNIPIENLIAEYSAHLDETKPYVRAQDEVPPEGLMGKVHPAAAWVCYTPGNACRGRLLGRYQITSKYGEISYYVVLLDEPCKVEGKDGPLTAQPGDVVRLGQVGSIKRLLETGVPESGPIQIACDIDVVFIERITMNGKNYRGRSWWVVDTYYICENGKNFLPTWGRMAPVSVLGEDSPFEMVPWRDDVIAIPKQPKRSLQENIAAAIQTFREKR